MSRGQVQTRSLFTTSFVSRKIWSNCEGAMRRESEWGKKYLCLISLKVWMQPSYKPIYLFFFFRQKASMVKHVMQQREKEKHLSFKSRETIKRALCFGRRRVQFLSVSLSFLFPDFPRFPRPVELSADFLSIFFQDILGRKKIIAGNLAGGGGGGEDGDGSSSSRMIIYFQIFSTMI